MSRYTPEHRARTRARIVSTAADLFRRHGYDGIGIERIMAEAGLTRGGFYHHFESKADLLAEVMAREADFVRRLAARDGTTAEDLTRGAIDVVSGYLDPANRERVGNGCSMASLAVDVARGNDAARDGFRNQFEALLAEFRRGLRPPRRRIDRRAIVAVALCVGGIVLSRALAPAPLGDRVARICRDAVADVLAS